MIIGIDDTDSAEGMCTTYLTAVLIERLGDMGEIRGYPHLIRLNPNIRYKTRGNAALAFEIRPKPGREAEIMNSAAALVAEMADLDCENTNPGIVFLSDEAAESAGFKHDLEEFMLRAVRDVLLIDDARELLDTYGAAYRGFKNGRGLIGALAACGAVLCGLPDRTYELIVYRRPENFGARRMIDRSSVFRADMETYPATWDTVDVANDVVVFAPHSPDPVLFGIRGDDTGAIEQAFNIIRSEPYSRKLMYLTNQGTDMHLVDAPINEVRDERSYRVGGTVCSAPRTIEGGHMFFTIGEKGGELNCAAFEPTKGFRRIIGALVPGDEVRVCGGVSKMTLNIEKIEILKLAAVEERLNPLCPACSRRMESAGRGQGYRCRQCGTSAGAGDRIRRPVERSIRPGVYEVPPCARRHISKPLIRCRGAGMYPAR